MLLTSKSMSEKRCKAFGMATGESLFVIPLGAFYCYGVWWKSRNVLVPN